MGTTMSNEDLHRWIGMRICKERMKRMMSQEALSEAAGVSRNFISMLENGNKAGRIDTYYRIGCALGISLSELFTAGENNKIKQEVDFILDDCTGKEADALKEILRAAKYQLDNLRR